MQNKERKRQKSLHEKKNSLKEKDEDTYIKFSHCIKKMKHTAEGKRGKNLTTGSLNNTAITAKRITVGVKGIFGNAKNSSSVYRDLMQRIENKKLSKASSSEIKESLTHIIQSCKSLDVSTTSRLDGFVTPGCDESMKSSRNEVCVVSRSISSCEDETEQSPMLNTPYEKIAERMQSSLPQIKLFKSWNYLKDVKDHLKKIYNTKYPMDLAAKFHLKDYSDVPPAKKSCIETVNQEDCGQEIKKGQLKQLADITNVERKRTSNTLFKTNFCENNQSSDVIPQKSNAVQREDKESSNELFDWKSEQVSHSQSINKTATRSPFLYPFTISDRAVAKPDNLQCFHHDPSLSKKPDKLQCFHRDPSLSKKVDKIPGKQYSHRPFISSMPNQCLNNLRNGGAPFVASSKLNIRERNQSTSSALTILNQPINTLRRNRRQTSHSAESVHSTEEIVDILDYIDSIPIKILESELLGRNDKTTPFFDTELVKPSLESPSPPKYYRMSMF